MPPKKNAIKTSKPKNTQKKATRKRIIKENPKFKTPSLIRIRLPSRKSLPEINVNSTSPKPVKPNETPPKVIKKKVSTQNEVVTVNKESLPETNVNSTSPKPVKPNETPPKVIKKTVSPRNKVVSVNKESLPEINVNGTSPKPVKPNETPPKVIKKTVSPRNKVVSVNKVVKYHLTKQKPREIAKSMVNPSTSTGVKKAVKRKGRSKKLNYLVESPSVDDNTELEEPTADKNTNGDSPENIKINETSPKPTVKQILHQRKIELANEVIRHHFPQQKTFEQTISEIPTANSENKEVVKRRVKSKKIPDDLVDSLTNIESTESEEFVVKKPKRIYTRKVPVKQIVQKATVPTEDAEDNQLETANKIESKSVKKAKSNLQTETSMDGKESTGKAQKIKSTKPRIIRRTPRGKKNSINNTAISEAAVVDQNKDDKKLKVNDADDTKLSKTPILPKKKARHIDSRKTSTASNSECMSWTKDISSSSTTTSVTVCSTDIVRIDKKFPVLKIPYVDYKLKKRMKEVDRGKKPTTLSSTSSPTSKSESSDDCSKCKAGEQSIVVDGHTVNLSTSSVSEINASQETCHVNKNNSISKISKALDKLTSNLKKIDMEILNWIGYQNEEVDIDALKAQERMFRILKEESAVIMLCKNIKRVLSDEDVDANNITNMKALEAVVQDENNFIKPDNVSLTKCIVNLKNTHNSSVGDMHIDNAKETSQKEKGNADVNYNNCTTDNVPHVPLDHSYDDDDALSLFAESITGIESSRLNSSVGSPPHKRLADEEEYIPRPVIKEQCSAPEKLVYHPTKIKYNEHSDHNIKTRTICEKQNADSTSINKEPVQDNTSKSQCTEMLNKVNLMNNCVNPIITNVAMPKEKNSSYLMSSIYKPSQAMKSVVFKGICFFHIVSSCRHNALCRFPHVIPNTREIKAKLCTLSEEMFIQEYMMMRNWPGLRRLYGLCFVEEAARRELTCFLVEMAMDFVTKVNCTSREDGLLKIEVAEFTLLHLNTVDLETCDNLLKYSVREDALLCDVFMEIIAATQNFSRFKLVFLNLTWFIVKINRSFSLNVATQILERVCILPYEEPLIKALLNIIRHTDPAIFENTVMGKFEKQLLNTNRDLYDQLMVIRRENMNRTVMENLYVSSSRIIREVEPPNVGMYPEREKRYTSPDTTYLDNLNKDEPVIKRTINFDPSRSFSVAQRGSATQSNEGYDKWRSQHAPNFSSWRNRSFFNKIPTFNPPQRTLRPPLKRPQIHRHVTYGGSPSKFPRRSGPDFF
ncbi:uncharacterized protein LOC113515090 isoform X2 [Galleria mellonella]|uniref:Uncharacterized protein LOC113515090 isoform X2 n=1 Tax=Galleria mellonella TaxID=7137 RepID=A0A6J1WRW4_GALME|nr:uncharacterized protein LOC113515090 isoform X2 [Galleria mellonella]